MLFNIFTHDFPDNWSFKNRPCSIRHYKTKLSSLCRRPCFTIRKWERSTILSWTT
jgi:hypothetical protein